MGQDSSTTLGFMVVNPDGTISYVFNGHVVATGVDLLASTNLTPPADRKTRWLRQSDGAEVAYIAGYESGAGEGQDWRTLIQTGNAAFVGGADVEAIARSDAGSAALRVAIDHTGFANLQADAVNATRQILKSDNTSDFGLDYGLRTSLPNPATIIPSPVDGARMVYTDNLAAPTFAWQLVWDSSLAGTNKWLCVGGSPMFAEVAGTDTTASAVYVALATAGPTITVPEAGDYMVEIGAQITHSGDTQSASMSYAIGATAAADADRLEYWSGASLSITTTYSGFTRPRKKSGLAAGTALAARYKTTAANASFAQRWMSVMPVRIGP